MRASLTFDDGPSAWTEPILELLAEHSAYATFFVCGHAVAKHRDIVRRAYEHGHDIGNHTYNHPHLTALDDDEVRTELAETSDAIAAATGPRPTLWRAPHFIRDERVDRIAAELGMRHVGCTVDPGDWKAASASKIAASIATHLTAGAIIDLHDGIPPNGGTGTQSRQPTVDALRLILTEYPGVEWVSVTQLETP